MTEKVKEILDYGSESHLIDFKINQYPIEKHPKKHELLKDISAMANHPSNEDKYIIIGIKKRDGYNSEIYPISELVDEAKYQQYIGSNLEPKINFEYQSIKYKGNNLAYFRIYENKDRPYLVKKELRNHQDSDKIEYREGDGFIRVGTSTKKITRKELDEIYSDKYRRVDRKSDLKITPYLNIPDDQELSKLNLRYFDISLENVSNHSIDLDVEMKIFKKENLKFVTEDDLRKEMNRMKREQSTGFGVVIPHIPTNFDVSLEDYSEFLLISRIALRYQKNAINLPQKAIERDIFCQYLFIVAQEPTPINAELIIRSDDFTEGILKEKIEIMSDS
jgi:predicted HTH transcriptional regulator